MEVNEAIQRAQDSEEVKSLKDYVLCSCFACLKDAKQEITEWTLLFYNKKKNVVLDCFVGSEVTLGEDTPPITDVEDADFSKVTVSAEQAIKTAAEKFSGVTINVLITLHRKGIWTINMISPAMMATTYDIDGASGKILREETTSLIRKV